MLVFQKVFLFQVNITTCGCKAQVFILLESQSRISAGNTTLHTFDNDL